MFVLKLIQALKTSQYKKNCQNYFFNTMTNIKNFDPNLLSIDQISLKNTDCVIHDITFEPDDDLPLGNILNIPVCVIIVRSVFQESNKYYPQVFLHECFYEYEYKYEDDSYVIV